MPRMKRILVAVKAPASRTQVAVRKAAQLAAATGARLELFHALTTPLYVDAFAIEGLRLKEAQQKWRQRATQQLERHAAKLRATGLKVDVSCDWDFPAYEAVVRRASRIDADLIVAERHATKHLLPWLLRFNDWELLRRSPVPVLLLKRTTLWRKPVIVAAIDPQHSFAKPAKLDDAILDLSAQLAEALGGSLHVVHASAASLQPVQALVALPAELGAAIERQAAADARKAFNRELEGRDIPASRRHLITGHPMDVIPAVAKKKHASLVVMGGISRSGLKRLVIGNVAEQVLDALPCDVLVLKPLGFRSKVPARSRGAQLLATPPYV